MSVIIIDQGGNALGGKKKKIQTKKKARNADTDTDFAQ